MELKTQVQYRGLVSNGSKAEVPNGDSCNLRCLIRNAVYMLSSFK